MPSYQRTPVRFLHLCASPFQTAGLIATRLLKNTYDRCRRDVPRNLNGSLSYLHVRP
jgi:hypothetical protein